MDIPKKLLNALGIDITPKKPVVFIRPSGQRNRVERVDPDGSDAYSLRRYLKNPITAGNRARRTYRQAIVLRAVDGKLRHYPLWAVFSSPEVQDQLALKHNQQAPDLEWVKAKRHEVAQYLRVKPNTKMLEKIDSLAQPPQ